MSSELNQPNQKNGKTWKMFIWGMGIVLILFGTVFSWLNITNGRVDRQAESTASLINGQNIKIETYNKGLSEVKTDIREIKTNLFWIMKAFNITPDK